MFEFRKYKLLSLLFCVQFLILFVVVILVSYGMLREYNVKKDKVFSEAKNSIVTELESVHNEIRTYKFLNLQSALDNSLSSLRSKYPYADFSVVYLDDVFLGKYDFIYPKNNLDDIGVVVAVDLKNSIYQNLSFDNDLFFVLISAFFVALFLIYFTQFFIRRYIYKPILFFLKSMEGDDSGNDQYGKVGAIFEMKDFIHHIEALQNDKSEYERLKVFDRVSKQLSHDIRSPLSVLSTLSEDLNHISERDRIMLRMAVQGVRDIANDLSSRSESGSYDDKLLNQTKVCLVSAIIEAVVSEKRIEYKSRSNVSILGDLNRNTYHLFSQVNPINFKRVLSNLINNSIESFTAGGDVKLQLQSNEGFVQILVKDNGKGIPADKLDSIFERGKSFGKERKENSGLGLYHAKESIESWGGTISVESEVGVGTEFTITLPLAKQPNWFLGKIILKQDKQFVIIDDDQSIHEIWKNRLGEAGASVQQMQHFSSADSFEKWIHATDKSDRYLFLFDYELLGSKKTGLDLIEEFGLQNQAVLVTSRYEEPSIRERCQKIGLKLLPKSLAGYVPIVKEASYVVPKQRVDCVFVDDNDLVRMNWERKAAEVGINILTFGNTTDFYKKLKYCDEDTVFFIDHHLNDGTYGLDTAKDLKQKGFHKIYMASGFDADELGVPKGIVKGCVGKKPPFDDLTVFNRAKQSDDDDER